MARLAEVAQKLGYALSGRGAERRLSLCPACREGPGDASLNIETECWKCHRASCDAGGGPGAFVAWHLEGTAWPGLTRDQKRRVREFLDAHGVERSSGQAPARLYLPEPPLAPRSLTAATRWDEVLASAGPSAIEPSAETWLRARFGDALAEALRGAPLPVLAAPPPEHPLWRWARQSPGYRVAIPVFVWSGPDQGQVADFRLRWCGPGPAPGDGKRKEVGLANALTDAGGLARFMGDPTRVTTTTPTIVITEGGADYLVAEALRLAGLLPKAWVIVGLPGAGTAGSLGVALGARLIDLEDLDERDERPEPTRIILAIDADAGGDKACHALFVEFQRAGAHVVVHRAGPWPNGHDLGDRLKLLGAAATAGEIVDAGPYAPTPIASAPSIYGDAEPVRLVDLRLTLPALLARFARQCVDGARMVSAVPFGGGKTTAGIQIPLRRAQGEALPQVVIALASWNLVGQKRKQLRQLAEDAGVTVRIGEFVGVGEGCRNGKHPDTGDAIRARDLFLAAGRPPGWRRDACPGCPLRPKCRAHKKPSITSDVIFTTHASLAHLPKEWAGRFVIIIDEAPKAVLETSWSVAHLRGPEDVSWASRDTPEALDALETLRRAWSHALRDPALDVVTKTVPARHLQRLVGRDLGAALARAVRSAAGETGLYTFLDLMESASTIDPRTLPRPDIQRLLREGKAGSRISVRRDLPSFYAAVLEVVRAAVEDREPDAAAGRLAMVIPRASQGGPPCFELRRPAKLPEGFGAVALDATALVTPHFHTSYLGPDVTIVGLPVLPHPEARTVRVHVVDNGLGRSRILPAGKETWTRLSRVISRAVAEAGLHMGQGWQPKTAGFISYGEICQGIERRPAEGPLAQCQAAVAKLATGEVHVGTYGSTSRASNAFENVDVLVTLGDPWPDVGAHRLDLAAMGYEGEAADAMLRASVTAELAQAMGRARAEVRPDSVLLVHIGSVLPAGWDAKTVIRIAAQPPGRPRAQDAVACRSWLEAVAERVGVLSTPLARAISRWGTSSAETYRGDPIITVLAELAVRPKCLISLLMADIGAPPDLPPDRRLRKLIDEATHGPRWRAVGTTSSRFRVREDLTDDEGRMLLGFFSALAEAKSPTPPDVSPRAKWWWPDELSDEALPHPPPAAGPDALALRRSPEKNDNASVDSCPFARSR
jgi:hypothetical protein